MDRNWLGWQRTRRRRGTDEAPPPSSGPFWPHFFEATLALAEFDEPRALELLTAAQPALPEDEPVRAAFDETFAEVHFLRNDYTAALTCFQQAQQRWHSLGERLSEAEVRGWRGACLVQLGQYREGYEQLHTAIETFESVGVSCRGSRALNYLAIVHEELGDYPRAFEVYERARAAAIADRDADMHGRVLANLGEAYVVSGRGELGLPVLAEAVEVLRTIGAHWHYGWCLLAIGRLHAARGDDAQALAFHRDALDAVERGHSPRARVEVYAGMGEFLSKRGEHEQGLTWLQRALELAESTGVKREIFKTHKLFAEAHKRAGDFRSALEHHEHFHEVRSEVFDQLSRERVATLKAEFELERVNRAYAQLEEKANTLTHLSRRDGLTGLFNRRHFDEALQLEVGRARSLEQPLTLLLLDIDHFKRVNDVHSHVVGDSVLRLVASVLERELRQSDLCARYGGEEFAVLLPHTALEGGRIAAEKLRIAIATTDWAKLTPGMPVTASLGLAQWNSTEDSVDLVRRADHALYAAKNSGRNRVRAA